MFAVLVSVCLAKRAAAIIANNCLVVKVIAGRVSSYMRGLGPDALFRGTIKKLQFFDGSF